MEEELKPIQPEDIYTENKVAFVNKLTKDTGYPYNLTDKQVVRLIYFFGARKLARKALKADTQYIPLDNMTSLEKEALKEIFKWFGFETPTQQAFKTAYNALTIRFKELLSFLRARPAFITPEIYQALQTAGYSSVLKNIVLVIDKNRKIVPRLVAENSKVKVPPLGQMESLLWDIQSMALDKLKVIIENITVKDIKSATLGTKAKALRDIYAMLHMAKQSNKNPNLTLINLNVNATDPSKKLATYSEYITKNRQD